MVRLVLLKLSVYDEGVEDGTYGSSTFENLKKHHTGNKYLNVNEEEVNGPLLDILRDMEEVYKSVGAVVYLDEEKEILYIKGLKLF